MSYPKGFEDGMDEWLRDIGALDSPDSETLDDMQVQNFHDDVQSHELSIVYRSSDVALLKSDLAQLQTLQQAGLIPTDVPCGNVNGQFTVIGDERLSETYRNMNQRYVTLENGVTGPLDFSAYGRQPGSIAKQMAIGEINPLLQKLSQYEKVYEENEVYGLMLEETGYDFSKFVNVHVQAGKQITDSAVARLNKDIQSDFESKCLYIEEQMSQAYSYNAMAEKSRMVRAEHNVSMYQQTIPYAMEQEIGTDSLPHELDAMEAECTQNVEHMQQYGIPELYRQVYALESVDWENVPATVTGHDRDWRKTPPTLIKKETIEMLGPDYKEFSDKQFDKMLSDLRAEHVDKKESVLPGVDVSRKSVDSTELQSGKAKTIEADKSMDREIIGEPFGGKGRYGNDNGPTVGRAVSDTIQEITNTCVPEDSYSFDEIDYVDKKSDNEDDGGNYGS